VSQTTDKKLDPELVCTRVMARLIEDVGCVVIAPDSPAWSDLGGHGAGRAGELRVYRGRGRVQKIVSSHLNLGPGNLDSHTLVVLTHPESPVPHLVLDTMREGMRMTVHVDLLPKRDLAVSPEYLERCFEPLSEARQRVEEEAHFVPTRTSVRQRALLSPWGAHFTLEPRHLQAAEAIIGRYLTHWVELLRSAAVELSAAPELAARDQLHRRIVFSRAADPIWRKLDGVIGSQSVDSILSALTE
jgi:Red chlorophyll catabolite reductase (RCC reductase)